MLKSLIQSIKQRLCKHEFVPHFRDGTKAIHRCPKCGKLFYTRLS